jgi:hypothetical protein
MPPPTAGEYVLDKRQAYRVEVEEDGDGKRSDASRNHTRAVPPSRDGDPSELEKMSRFVPSIGGLVFLVVVLHPPLVKVFEKVRHNDQEAGCSGLGSFVSGGEDL